MTETIFLALGIVALVGGVCCIAQRNPLSSAVWLVVTMLALAGMQVLVYAGAVMVLFIFVIMLLNLGHGPGDIRGPAGWAVSLVLVAGMASYLLRLAGYGPDRLALELTGTSDLPAASVFAAGDAAQQATQVQGVVGAVAGPLFSSYLVPFEVTSILLLAAIVGGVVLAKKRI
jgi:NADH-quinone oxidoreductase subunit J